MGFLQMRESVSTFARNTDHHPHAVLTGKPEMPLGRHAHSAIIAPLLLSHLNASKEILHMERMLAMIVPLGGADQIPGSPGSPSHPIAGFPDQGLPPVLPEPPPGVWPPPTAGHPIVPAPPNTPPGAIWPPAFPSHPISGGGGGGSGNAPGQGLPPTSPGSPGQGLPPTSPGSPSHPIATPPSGNRPDNSLPGPGKFWIVAGIPGYGWRYVCVDPSLGIDNSLPPGAPATPDQGLPPATPPSPGQGLPPTAPPTATPKA
jgi:hypothetical protein